jgi:hypothetical protein
MAVCISVTDDAHARDLVNFLTRSCGVDPSAFDKCPKIDSSRQEDIHEVLGYFVPHVKTIFQQVEFEAECSFAILSSLWHSLCVLQSDSPNGLLVKVITPLAAAVAAAATDPSCIAGPPCIFRSLASLYNNAKGCMHAQVVCLRALFESAASSGNFAAVSDFYGSINKLCDAWGASVEISRALQLSAVKGLVAARKTHSQPVHTVLRAYLASFQGASQDVLQSMREYADVLCIDVASRLDVFQFDDFLSLDAVQVASPDLLRVLHCVAREDMNGLRKLQAEVPSLASVHGIDMKLLEEKMRLLSFASAASSKVMTFAYRSNLRAFFVHFHLRLTLFQAVLTFDECAAHMDIKVEEVEKWIVQVVSSGIADCKIRQQVGRGPARFPRLCTRVWARAHVCLLHRLMLRRNAALPSRVATNGSSVRANGNCWRKIWLSGIRRCQT